MSGETSVLNGASGQEDGKDGKDGKERCVMKVVWIGDGDGGDGGVCRRGSLAEYKARGQNEGRDQVPVYPVPLEPVPKAPKRVHGAAGGNNFSRRELIFLAAVDFSSCFYEPEYSSVFFPRPT